jgi:hypothetical protein
VLKERVRTARLLAAAFEQLAHQSLKLWAAPERTRFRVYLGKRNQE